MIRSHRMQYRVILRTEGDESDEVGHSHSRLEFDWTSLYSATRAVICMLAAGSKVGYKAFTLIQNDSLIDEGWVKAQIATAGKCVHSARFLARREGFSETSGNIRLNASPLAESGSSFGKSSGWVSPLFAGSASGGFTSSSGIIPPSPTFP